MSFRLPFFKSRSSETAAPNPAESLELMRRRSRHRLIGAAVLVLVGVVGFPLLFDTQPRPIPVDIAIDIPDKNTVKPLVVPGEAAPRAQAAGPVVAGPVAAPASAVKGSVPAPKVPDTASLAAKEEIVAAAPAPAKSDVKPESRPQPVTRPEPKAPAKAEVKPEPKPEPVARPESRPPAEAKPEPKATAKPEAPADDGTRAKALLEGKTAPKADAEAAASGERYVIQVAAFADAAKAREARLKLEHAGLKTYTQIAQTKDGPRIRVRVGPFATKAEADKVLAKVNGLSFSASLLVL
jgi:DedD protein